MRNNRGSVTRGMAALMATIAVVQLRPATGAPADIFVSPAPVIGSDPPKATELDPEAVVELNPIPEKPPTPAH